MRFIKIFLCLSFLMLFSCKRTINDVSEKVPAYKLIKEFSKKINKDAGFVLYSYGINIGSKPKNVKYGIANFSVGYFLFKDKHEMIDLEEARRLLVFITENFLREINSNKIVRPDLDIFPFTSNQINIHISFKDENKIDLGNGVACIYFLDGKIKYERYEIHEYRNTYPASGKHYLIHEETYKDAFDIVKGKNTYIQTNQLQKDSA